jgi:hypothetical protein
MKTYEKRGLEERRGGEVAEREERYRRKKEVNAGSTVTERPLSMSFIDMYMFTEGRVKAVYRSYWAAGERGKGKE